jgi:hypothetical protein
MNHLNARQDNLAGPTSNQAVKRVEDGRNPYYISFLIFT